MSKSNAFETALLKLFFNGTAIADLAENDSSSPATTLTIALHTADPGEAGVMTANEAAYTSYARETVTRNATEFPVVGNEATFANDLDFTKATGGNETITHFSIGTGVSDNIMYYGTISPNLVIANGVIPRLEAGTSIAED